MRTPSLMPHGSYIRPEYLSGDGQSNAGKSIDAERSDGQFSGIVKRFKKKDRASDIVLSFDSIKRTYADAIEYTSSKQSLRGMASVIAIPGTIYMAWSTYGSFINDARRGVHNIVEFILLVIPVLIIIFNIYIFVKIVRQEFFCPTDLPIIFDRKNRKVYRLLTERCPGYLGLFKPWPLRACEYDWDLIDAEHTAVVSTTGSTVMRRHALVFVVKRSSVDPTIIDSFNVGDSVELGETTVPALWEHIRRFMEESGPHIPPGESLAPALLPQTLWQSLSAVGPFGASYKVWWSEHRTFMMLIHIMFFFFVPMFLLWGFFNWLSYKTSISVEWPREVKDAIGKAQSIKV